MNIICKKTNCQHNKNFVCCANKIDIRNEANCDSFEKQNLNNNGKQNNQNCSPKFDSFKPRGKLKIYCRANCQFNKNKECHANGITVNNLEQVPYCITYFKKIVK